MSVIVSEDEVDGLIKRFIECAKELRENFTSMADIAGKLSPAQLKRLKKAVKYLGMSGSRVDCLALLGRGVMADHLALRDKTLDAGFFLRLPLAAREKLNTKGFPMEVLTMSGVIIKPVEECTTYELGRMLDAKRGILSATAQAEKLKAIVAPSLNTEYEEFEKLQVQDRDLIVITGKNGSRIGVPIKTLRNQIR